MVFEHWACKWMKIVCCIPTIWILDGIFLHCANLISESIEIVLSPHLSHWVMVTQVDCQLSNKKVQIQKIRHEKKQLLRVVYVSICEGEICLQIQKSFVRMPLCLSKPILDHTVQNSRRSIQFAHAWTLENPRIQVWLDTLGLWSPASGRVWGLAGWVARSSCIWRLLFLTQTRVKTE